MTRYKDGTELSANERLLMTSDADRYSLSIINTDKSDAGEYKITVSNETSRLSCTASLLVVGMTNTITVIVQGLYMDSCILDR